MSLVLSGLAGTQIGGAASNWPSDLDKPNGGAKLERRRVVTGSRQGEEVVVDDRQLDAFDVNGVTVVSIWRVESVPTVPTDGSMDQGEGFPTPGGLWVTTAAIPAQTTWEPKKTWERGAAASDPTRSAFHHSDSVDIGYVVSGAVFMEIEDGSELELRSGETVVINGTGHAWHNRNEVPAVLVLTVYGAIRAAAS